VSRVAPATASRLHLAKTGADSGAEPDHLAAKEALTADLQGMIDGMLITKRFATSSATRTRDWMLPDGAATPEAPVDASAFTANSLVADLAKARTPEGVSAEGAGRRRRSWLDAVLGLACLLSVISAAYFALAH